MKTAIYFPTRVAERPVLIRLLLRAGILSSLWYVAMNIFVPWGFEGYSYSTHTVSELSAVGAPTRTLWVWLGTLYTLLFAVFGWGVVKSAEQNKRLKWVGLLILGYCALNIYWPPMHARGEVPTLIDTLHIVWVMIAVIFMMLMMGFAAAALGRRFRIFTVCVIVLHFGFGMLTSLDAPNIPANLPTPWMGVWERVLVGLFLLWVVVLAIILLRKTATLQPAA